LGAYPYPIMGKPFWPKLKWDLSPSPISVNKRIAKEFIENGIVKKYSEFKHEFFREYH